MRIIEDPDGNRIEVPDMATIPAALDGDLIPIAAAYRHDPDPPDEDPDTPILVEDEAEDPDLLLWLGEATWPHEFKHEPDLGGEA